MSDTESAVFVAYIVSHIKAHVDFLVEQNYLSPTDANVIIAKLPSSSPSTDVNSPVARTLVPPHVPALPQRTRQVQARAIWAYNQNSEGDDLSFAAGDIITVIEENNADWWTGTVNGRSGLFPSSYVEKLSPAPAPSVSKTPFVTNSTTSGSKTPYRPFGAAHHGRDVPPPPGQGVNSVGLQEKSGKEEKKSKFGKYGDTMAQSAVGAAAGGVVSLLFS